MRFLKFSCIESPSCPRRRHPGSRGEDWIPAFAGKTSAEMVGFGVILDL